MQNLGLHKFSKLWQCFPRKKQNLTGCGYVVKGLQNPYKKLPNDVFLGNKSGKKRSFLPTVIYLCKCDSIMFSPHYLQNLFNNFSTTSNKQALVQEGTTLVSSLAFSLNIFLYIYNSNKHDSVQIHISPKWKGIETKKNGSLL